jgi:SAM-dependent methyltransferase
MPATNATSAPPAYPLGHSERELDRLAAQALRLANDTATLFERAGLRPGQRVLDIGCGAGDVSFLAADLVGATGRVVGIDASADAVGAARTRAAGRAYDNVEFRVGDLGGPLPALTGFDVVVGRLVLMYVGDPVAVLRRLRGCLKPGGLVVLQEPDGETAGAWPECPLLMRVKGWIMEAFVQSGSLVNLGSALGGMLGEAGYAIEGSFVSQPSLVGRTLAGIDWFADVLRSLLPVVVARNIATAEEIDIDTLAERLHEEALARNAMVFKPRFVGIWARSDAADAHAGTAP